MLVRLPDHFSNQDAALLRVETPSQVVHQRIVRPSPAYAVVILGSQYRTASIPRPNKIYNPRLIQVCEPRLEQLSMHRVSSAFTSKHNGLMNLTCLRPLLYGTTTQTLTSFCRSKSVLLNLLMRSPQRSMVMVSFATFEEDYRKQR